MMTKIALAVALAIAVLAAVPASAHPNHCQEDLGYGRTGSFGCGAKMCEPDVRPAGRRRNAGQCASYC
jgi:hypothetical protein